MPQQLDLTNKKFNMITVISKVGVNNHGQTVWLCRCDCGKYKKMIGSNVVFGISKSCGCLVKITNTNQERIKDMTNRVCGLLTVKRLVDKTEYGIEDMGAYWLCDCKCGSNDVIVKGKHLRNGKRKSCGCLNGYKNKNK
jgi:hypothetical protein